MCKAIDDPALGNDTFAKLHAAANIYYNYSGGAKCFDLADDSDPHGLNGWQWQVAEYFSPLSFLKFHALCAPGQPTNGVSVCRINRMFGIIVLCCVKIMSTF